MSGLRVTIGDCRTANYCASGVREFFETANIGVSFREFVKNGIEAEKLAATGSAHAARVVGIAEQRARRERDGR